MVRANQGSLTQNKGPIIPLGGGLALKKQTHNADSFSNLVSEVFEVNGYREILVVEVVDNFNRGMTKVSSHSERKKS